MKSFRFFAVLCCAAAVFAACDKENEPANNGQQDASGADGHEWVDLGLSVKWATMNVGATAPEEYGNYYAWGETEPKETYSLETYKYGTYNYDGGYIKLTKYCTDADYGKDGFADGKTVLDPEDDAASVNWGGAWRMPTYGEWTELSEQCERTWTYSYKGTGVAGRIFTSKVNGNSIFLPAAGSRGYLADAVSYCDYWSSSLETDYPFNAWDVYYDSDEFAAGSSRSYGYSVRPVLGN